jgi:hypothetical protein
VAVSQLIMGCIHGMEQLKNSIDEMTKVWLLACAHERKCHFHGIRILNNTSECANHWLPPT